ncbi:hypothetical protein D3C73_1371950 [compost metagenome]
MSLFLDFTLYVPQCKVDAQGHHINKLVHGHARFVLAANTKNQFRLVMYFTCMFRQNEPSFIHGYYRMGRFHKYHGFSGNLIPQFLSVQPIITTDAIYISNDFAHLLYASPIHSVCPIALYH